MTIPSSHQPITYLIFARTPRLGEGKTRLAATLGVERTLRLYEAMLADTMRSVHCRNAHRMILFAYPPDTTPEMADWCRHHQCIFPEMLIQPQHGTTLGEQMLLAFRYAEHNRLLPAIILGTDTPTLPQTILAQAENELQQSNAAVIGRSSDGGFYALGLPLVQESFFFEGGYSNDTVFERTCAALRQVFSEIKQLPEWTDIDDADSLRRVVEEAQKRQSSHYSQINAEFYETVRLAENNNCFV